MPGHNEMIRDTRREGLPKVTAAAKPQPGLPPSVSAGAEASLASLIAVGSCARTASHYVTYREWLNQPRPRVGRLVASPLTSCKILHKLMSVYINILSYKRS